MRLVVVVLLGVAVLAGCASAPDKVQANSESVPPPPAVTAIGPQQWLGQVCEALTPVARSATPPPETDPADVVGSKQAMLGYLEERLAAVQAGIDGLNEAGPPPTEGRTSAASTVELLRERHEALELRKAELTAVPDASTGTIVATLGDIRSQVLLPEPSTLGDLVVPPGLESSAAQVPPCVALRAP